MKINVFAVDDDHNAYTKYVSFEELCKHIDHSKTTHEILKEMD